MIVNFDSVSSVQLSDLNLSKEALKVYNFNSNLVLSGVSEKSHLVRKDFVFLALSGTTTHGANFTSDAVSRGATLIISDTEGEKIIKKLGLGIPIYIFRRPREILARISSIFFKAQPSCIVGVTGTNGKTSVAHYVRQIWEFLGEPAASIGTTGVNGLIDLPLEHTTPDPIKLHWLLNQMVARGINKVIIEASSHGLEQGRLHAIEFSVGAFTNLSRDHFDYHGDMESYFKSKTILFNKLISENGEAVISIDDKYGARISKLGKLNASNLVTVGKNKSALIRLVSQNFHSRGQEIKMAWEGREYIISLPLFGDFQANNVLLALGILCKCGENPNKVINLLSRLKAVPGRMEEVAVRKNGARIFVDYAHTPDALDAALRSIRAHFMGQIHLVFGAGGNRDKGKREMMGRVASQLTDNVIITDDNPRNENPAAIRSEIKKFCPKATVIADRAKAILVGVDQLKAGDALIIAGKGHEKTQTFANSILPFDDVEQASSSVAVLDGQV